MKSLDQIEISAWCKRLGLELDEAGTPDMHKLGRASRRFLTPTEVAKQLSFSRLIEWQLRPWGRCLLWATSWGIWNSSENWHLYYALRHSCGDDRLIEQAPALLFLDFEAPAFVSFVQIALSSGWDFVILTDQDDVRIRCSHDGWLEIGAEDVERLNEFASGLEQLRP